MAVTKQQLAQWSREFAAKNPDKVSGAGSTAQNTTTKKSSVTKEQLSQWSREFDKKEAQRQAEQEQNARAKALQQYTERHISDMGEVDARNEPSQALRASSPRGGNGDDRGQWPKQGGAVGAAASRMQATAKQTLGAATRAQSATGVSGKFPLDAGSSVGRKMAGAATEDSGSGPARQMPEAAARALDMGRKWGVPAKSGNVLENVGSGAMAYGTGRAQELRASFAKDSVPDEFDRINQWMDTGDNKNLADAVRRVDNTHGAYTDADLIQKGGWTQEQIDEARKMNAALDAIPAWQRGVRRAANAIGGIGDTVAAAPVLGAEYGVQAEKNIDATLKNWKQVEQEVKGDEHAQSLFDLLTDVDMDYNLTWPESRNRELISMGYNSKEIREMRQKLAGLEVSDGIDKNQSVGYQLYDRGQQLTAAAQSGLSPAQRAVAGAVTSAAENLAIAAGGDGVAWILPMLSAQGAAEAMGQSAEKGESAGKALGGGLAKFGAGWAINSVGAADLAKTMGSDYAKDTMAGQIADWVQGLAGSSELAKRYPAVAAAISGGIDNSMQAFAETYADMAIDAALGDSEAAKNLFTKDTFLTALESGLSGGASGALGGAIGTRLRGMSEALDREAERYDRMKRAAAQQKEWEARTAEPSQPASPAATENISGQEENLSPFPSADAVRERSSPIRGAFLKGNSTESMQRADAPQAQTEGVNSSVNEAATQSENPAVRQFAEVAASDSLTGKTIGLFTPNAENRENRAAFEQAYGVTLPDTAAATRRMLREIAAQQNVKSEAAPAAQSAELPSEAASVPQTVQDTPAETADAMPETAAPDNVREAAAAAAETDSYENAPLRETLGLRPEAPKTQREAEVQRALEGWRVTDKAAETISKNMPDRVDADRYAAAASPLYRLGRSGADTFAQALELAGSMSGTAADINYILSTDAGRTALEIAYTQGKGERMLYAEKMTGLGGTLGSESTSGRGEVYAKGTMRQESDPASQIISLNAAATGTDAILYNVLQNDRSIRAYVDTETARIFFGDNAQDIFGTVLHEDYHWYNALDAEGARTLQEHALEYLAKNNGYESLDEMIRAKLRDYSAQSLTYEQAAEELVADAWRGIFDSEESFKRWVTFQRGQAEKNAGKSGAIHKVMEQVRQMLDGLINRAKEVLTADPDNRAALKAKRLAEAEKRTLQDEYFAHAEKAMDNLRSAKENAAALKNESAAEGRGVRYSINPSYAQDIDEWNRDGRNSREIFVLGSTAEALQGLGARENDIYMKGDKISLILEQHPEMTLNEIKRIPEILDDPILVLSSRNKGRAGSQNTRLVLFGSVKAQDGRPVLCVLDLQPVENRIVIQDMQKATSAYTKDNDPVRFVRNSEVLYTSENKKRTTALLRTLGFQMPSELQRYGSMGSISYHGQNVKMEGVPFTEIEASGGTHVESEDSRSRLPKGSIYQESGLTSVLKTEQGGEAPKPLSKNSIAQPSGESKRTDEPVKKTVRFQRAEQADREAKQNQQRQASRVLAEKAAAFDTLNQFFGLTKNTRLSDAALESLAIRWTKTNGSRADRAKLANETRALVEYLRSEGADMAKAQGLAETLAGEVLDEATYRNTELWDEYPDLHSLTYTVDKNGKAKAELVKRYGSWTEAVAEARRHGVKLRQAEGYRDGNPAEQYEAIVNDTRAVGGVKESAAALFRSAAQEAGVAGAAGMESTEWLDVLMNVHDTIKPRMMSRFADAAEYEDAKVELAGRMIGDIMSHPEMTDAEAVFEGILKHNREVAAMAAGSEERAAEVTKGLKSVQQAQRKAFADRMRANSRSQSAEAKSVSRAERQLNENLETLGAQVSTAAGLDEKMTALREAYEREWKAEKSRMKQARQEMLDEIKLERQQMRSQINDLSRQVAGEQRRADRAERQLLVQENEIMEWEAENQRKAEAWQEKQAQRNAIAIETARQQRDEDVAVAKALAEKRVQKAWEGRKADELKRSIRNNAAQLNQMVLRPKPGKYVQKSLIVQAAEVAKLADMAVLNNNALTKLTVLQDSIRRSGEMDAGIHADWENSGVENLIQMLRDDMNASKQAKLDRLNKQLEEAKALPDGDKAEQLRDRLRQRIRETENRTYLPMTVDQLRMLKAITASTLHMIRTENKTLSLARAEEVDGMAMKAAREVLNSEGNGFGEKFEKAKGAMNRYQLDMLGGTRMFRRLGGYTKNGQMEKLGQMLNDGQRRQTEILVEGESLFANVTGKEHLKEVEAFAGPGAELVDIGLKDSKGNAVPLNHAQLCSLYMLLRNEDSRHHLMTGGLTLPDAAQYAKGNIERAYQRSQTVMLGTLVDADGTPMADTILQTVQDAMTDYDRNWCKDMEDFFGRYTTNLINETSMKLLGYDRATVKNYYPIAVDRSTLATEIEGVKMDATIEGRGFLKERVKSDKPILLEECQNVVKRSLRDTAAYAGLAAPIRDVQRVLNSTVETAEGIGVLKDKIIGEKWGKETVSYINDLLTDLQTTRRKRSSTMSRALDRMRGNYAGAILTVNPGVAIAQAASLPTAGAVLGADTMAAVLPFVKNFSGKQRAAVEAEIRQHGDALLQYRLRGTKRGEMSSIGAHKNLVAKASEAMPAVTGWITGMDEITVAALWEGSKRYVERHAAEFGEGAAEKGSEAYWEAVNKMYQRVIEETQPNYTTMQRAGIQRSDNEFVKTLTMFTTQRFQNYGILADAVGDYKAQKARYAADQSAENKAEVQRAGQSLRRAAASQVVQTAVFALMKIGADFLLHRWDKEQDENGDITAASVGKRFFDLYTESAAGNFLYGSEIYSALTNARDGKDYDVVSATNISAVNDLFAAFTKTVKLLRTDTGEMSEEELTAHHQKLNKAVLKDIQCGLELYGVPAANIRKVMQAFEGYWEDAQAIGRGEGFSFNSAPSSATGQYDRLYNAIQSGDSEEAAAAMKKLEQMNKTDKVDGELARRLKQYDADVLAAAKARNAGKARAEEKARKAVFEKLREGLDVAPVTDRAKGKTDAARRAQLIDLVNKAVDGKADELLAGSKDGSIYDALLDEVKNGRAEDAQEELDRLMTAGKDKGSIKSKITESVKEEYLAGSDRDREKLEKKLLALEDADENPLYEEKNFAQWVSAADKKAEKAKDEKNWWEGVK
jgi:hypothetical protein